MLEAVEKTQLLRYSRQFGLFAHSARCDPAARCWMWLLRKAEQSRYRSLKTASGGGVAKGAMLTHRILELLTWGELVINRAASVSLLCLNHGPSAHEFRLP